MEPRETARRAETGYVIALIGVVAFTVSCFLPLFHVPEIPVAPTATLYNQFVGSTPPLVRIGGTVFLFAGLVAVGVTAILGLLRDPPSWTVGALLGTVVVWSLSTVGYLVEISGVPGFALLAGFWLLLASVACVIAGTVLVVRSSTRHPASPVEFDPSDTRV